MRLPSYRPLFAAAALIMALSGLLTGRLQRRRNTRPAVNVWTVEVNEQGFNPRHCNIVRGDEVYFKNTGKVPIRVFKPGMAACRMTPIGRSAKRNDGQCAEVQLGGESIYKSGLATK